MRRCGEGVDGQHRAARRRRLQIKIIPDALPERIKACQRLLPQRVVAVKRQREAGLQSLLVETDLGSVGAVIWVRIAKRGTIELARVSGEKPSGWSLLFATSSCSISAE
jgi:hypothetical protein